MKRFICGRSAGNGDCALLHVVLQISGPVAKPFPTGFHAGADKNILKNPRAVTIIDELSVQESEREITIETHCKLHKADQTLGGPLRFLIVFCIFATSSCFLHRAARGFANSNLSWKPIEASRLSSKDSDFSLVIVSNRIVTSSFVLLILSPP